MDGRMMRCGIISSCQSAASSEIVKRLLHGCESITHVSSAYSKLSYVYLYLNSKISLNFNQDMKGYSETLQIYICLLVAVVKQ